MNTLTNFLLARIDEDERAAQEATGISWTSRHLMDGVVVREDDPAHYIATGLDYKDALHVLRHDPRRALLDCIAKRAVIKYAWASHVAMERIKRNGSLVVFQELLERTNDYPLLLLLMAQTYYDHEDMRREWFGSSAYLYDAFLNGDSELLAEVANSVSRNDNGGDER